jgi:hypothetical protein
VLTSPIMTLLSCGNNSHFEGLAPRQPQYSTIWLPAFSSGERGMSTCKLIWHACMSRGDRVLHRAPCNYGSIQHCAHATSLASTIRCNTTSNGVLLQGARSRAAAAAAAAAAVAAAATWHRCQVGLV